MSAEMKVMGDALDRFADVDRILELETISEFVGKASRIECKQIIDMLIERVSALDGLAPELEDASESLSRSIKANEVFDHEYPANPMDVFVRLRATGIGV